MRPCGLPTLITGAVPSAFAVSSAGQWALADSIEPVTLEAENGTSAICYSDDIAVCVPQPSSTPCPPHVKTPVQPEIRIRSGAGGKKKQDFWRCTPHGSRMVG